MKTILILEDNEERIAAFKRAIPQLGDGYDLRIWREAYVMRHECEAFFADAALITLKGDFVAKFLAECRPVCPVIICSSDLVQVSSISGELLSAGWIVEQIVPDGADWVKTTWLPKAHEFLAGYRNTWPARLPKDHQNRMQRALLSLDGLSIGDAFGERFFGNPTVAERRIEYRDPPPAPWGFTDDTAMALSIARCLKRYGHVERQALSDSFAREYARDPRRGYGGAAHGILQAIRAGTPWQEAAGRVFNGEGSRGNGGAMRSAPIGAYFADDLERMASEAKASAEVTHAHPDGQTGAMAVALAAAWMVREPERARRPGLDLIEFVLDRLPQTDTHYRLKRALELPIRLSPRTVALRLGNGSQIIASDTVPFCLWCAARHPDNFQEALWSAVSVYGDIDTNCAIVGGIVALSAGRESIPPEWLKAREPFTL
jgi:ADP-ribosylglycohydrolase